MRRLHLSPTLLLVLASVVGVACNGDDGKDDGTTDTSDTDPPVQEFVFQASSGAVAYKAGLTPDTIAAHQMSNMFLAAVAVVSADEKAADRLITDGGGEGVSAPTGEFECWERPEFPMWSFDLNFETCSDQGYEMGGGVSIEDHASGPLLYSFNSFNIEGRSLGGTLAFDTREAVDSPLFWASYNTDRSNPGRENDVQMGITVDGITSGAAWNGGSQVNFVESTWSMWGVLTLRPTDREFTVIHGGSSPEEVAGDDPQGSVVRNSLNWQTCRCPTEGTSTYELDLAFEELTIDLDDLELEPDDIDDPEITVLTNHIVSGTAGITYTGCGEQDIAFDVGATTVLVPNDTVVAATSYLCDIKVIEDTARCVSIVGALREVGEFAIAIPQEDVLATAQAAVNSDFDGAWCEVY